MVTITNSLTAGETFTADITEAADGTVSITLRGPEGHDIACSLVNGSHTATVATDTWKAGEYEVKVWLTIGGIKSIIQRGRLTVAKDAAVGDVTDIRSVAEKTVEAIELHLAGNGQDPTWKRYKINNREMERYSVQELLALLNYYKGIVLQEKRKLSGRSILGPRIAVRF